MAKLAADPLVTIGAHTVNHVMLAKVTEKSPWSEMEMSRSVIAAALGLIPDHLSYPVGDPTSAGPREFRLASELGFKTAVTTRPGVIFPEHHVHLTRCRKSRSTASASRCNSSAYCSPVRRRPCGTAFVASTRPEHQRT